MNYILIGLVLTSLLCFGYGIRFIAPHQEDLFDHFGNQRLSRVLTFLMVMPVMVLLMVLCLILFVWQIEPVLRTAHLLWVLGLWMP